MYTADMCVRTRALTGLLSFVLILLLLIFYYLFIHTHFKYFSLTSFTVFFYFCGYTCVFPCLKAN